MGKTWVARTFYKNDIKKYIGCIILTVTYGNEGYMIWGESNISEIGKNICLIKRDVCGNTDLKKGKFYDP